MALPDPTSNGTDAIVPPGDQIAIGDLEHAAGVAVGADARAQSVVVTVQQAVKQDLPEELSNYTLHQMIIGIIQAIQDLEIRLWENAKEDIEDRKARQKEADRHRRSVQRWLILLALGMFAGLVLTIYLITQ